MRRAALAIAMLVAGRVGAAEPPKAAALRWMVGAWQCEGKLGTSPWAFALAFRESLKGAWLDGDMKMGDFELTATIGYSAGEKGWVRWDRDSRGGTKMLTSEGPQGEAITFASAPVEGGFREEMRRTKLGLGGRIDVFRDGRWTTDATFDCKPAPR